MKAVGIAASQRIQCIVSGCSLVYKVSLGTGRICERVRRYMVHRMRTARGSRVTVWLGTNIAARELRQ